MQNSKFKKALSDELDKEYNSFYTSGSEHIFSPEFEEEMDRLISGKKRHKRLFAFPQRRLVLKYSLSACTALALCIGVMTIWENHIKDNVFETENMIVPSTTQTSVSIPETTDSDSGNAVTSTDPTEANTKVTQKGTATTEKPSGAAVAGQYPPNLTTVIGPQKIPVSTNTVIVTAKRAETSKASVKTTKALTTKKPVPTGTKTPGTATSKTKQTSVSRSGAFYTKTRKTSSNRVTIITQNTKGSEVTHDETSPNEVISPVKESYVVTEAPGTAITIPAVSYDGNETHSPSEIEVNTELPHIVFDRISWVYDGNTYDMQFSTYLSEKEYRQYEYVTEDLAKFNSYASYDTGTKVYENAYVRVVESTDTGELYLAVHFMATNTYCLYSPVG